MSYTKETDQKVRDFMHSMPGHFDATTPQECLRMAWGASGIQCAIDDIRLGVSLYGRKPIEIRPGLYRLNLGSEPISSYPANRRRR